ncbi:sce7726 family protein [Bradyrhizobium sp. AT1]|uniref:sce7726 family protein n=1 Tax=Bradyrhizobium sp. AT1 TaxID=574934 RepID=UPI000A012DA1|nr:sce7726 family protein [Bradyrhizobium sp. AT1]
MKAATQDRAAKAAVSRLFASSIIRELATRGSSSAFARLARETRLFEVPAEHGRVRDAFDTAFAALRVVGNRDEYIYKAALTHNVLLGTHSLKTASMLAEFRVGQCKADVAILNGTSTVYEIKSERDSLDRLEKQLESYKRVFARVFVITAEKHVDSILRSTDNEIGVLSLSARQTISKLRDARERPDRICPATVFESIRTDEAKLILKSFGIAIPDVPNTLMRAELRLLFARLNSVDLHTALVTVLKKTRNLLPLGKLVEDLPQSLTPAALTVPLRTSDHQRLLLALNARLEDAMRWGEEKCISHTSAASNMSC